VVVVLLGLSALCLRAGQSTVPEAEVQKKSAVVSDAYPGLASGCLTYAKLSDLPSGVILKAQDLVISQKEVTDEIAQAPEEMRAQLEKNGFFLLESLATRRLLALQAKARSPQQKEAAAPEERDLIQNYLQGLVASVQVSDVEVAKFYEENKDACGGATLDQVKDQIKQLVLQQKQGSLVQEHVRTLGQRMSIEVSAAWTKEQAVLAKDNPVEKARSSGRPALVDFGSTGCVPCEMLAPILETLKEKYAGKLNVLFIHVGQEQVLAARYGVQSIPTQFFYDKNGKEVFRHTGFWPQAEIEKKLAEMGVTP
jgi:thioredoxin 1